MSLFSPNRVDAICLWTTRYMNQVLDSLRAEGFEITEEDVERLSPLLGRYHFTLAESVRKGEMRPLRGPWDPKD